MIDVPTIEAPHPNGTPTMIDTHVHLLDPGRYPYPPGSRGYHPRPDEAGTLYDLGRVLDTQGIARAVLVAASVYGAANESLFDAAAAEPARFRVIAGVDPADPDTLRDLAREPGVAGVRLNLTNDRRLGNGETITALLAAAREAGLVVAIQAAPAHTRAALAGAAGLRVVLDHVGRPDLEGGLADLRALGDRPGTWLKLSGGFRIAPEAWPTPTDDMRAAVAAFPEDRLIWGSDWPFIGLGGPRPDYRDCLDWAHDLTGADLAANADALFWGAR